eukprot:785417-Amphidinium_carterae.2
MAARMQEKAHCIELHDITLLGQRQEYPCGRVKPDHCDGVLMCTFRRHYLISVSNLSRNHLCTLNSKVFTKSYVGNGLKQSFFQKSLKVQK